LVSPQQVARDTAETGLRRLVRTLAVVLPSVALLQTLANARDYRQPAVAIAVWLAVLGAGAWFMRRPRANGLAPRETVAAVVVAVGAVAAIGAVHRPFADPGSVDLAALGTAWLLVLIAMSHSARVWIPVALLVFVVQGTVLIREQGLTLLSLSQTGAAGYIIATILIAFAALRPTLDQQADLAARRASLASRAAAEHAAAGAVRQERQHRLAVLEQEALPLLRGIADGTLDPAAEDVRQRCAGHAAALRQALTEGPVAGGPVAGGPAAGGLVAGLEPALRTAKARGLPVTVQSIGDPGTPPPPIARAILAVVGAVLGALAPHAVVLTVLAASEDIELYLAFDTPLRAAPDLTRFGLEVPAAAHWRASLDATETGGGFLAVSWRKDECSG
jgi:hypothetical protein